MQIVYKNTCMFCFPSRLLTDYYSYFNFHYITLLNWKTSRKSYHLHPWLMQAVFQVWADKNTIQMRLFGHLVRMPTGRHLVKGWGQFPPVRGPPEDPGHTGETMSLSWPGNACAYCYLVALYCLMHTLYAKKCIYYYCILSVVKIQKPWLLAVLVLLQ